MVIVIPDRILSDTTGGIVIPRSVYGPLGGNEGSNIHILLVEPINGRPGELFFSTLDLRHWRDHVKIVVRSSNPRTPFIQEAFPEGWSVLLSESSGVRGKPSIHTAIAIDVGNSGFTHDAERLAELTRCFAEEGDGIQVSRFASLGVVAWWVTTAAVEGGQLILKGEAFASWRALIQAQLALADGSDVFDPGRYGITIDTELRLGRIYFLKPSTRSLDIEVDDKPGALTKAVEALQAQDYRVLASYLKRHPGGRGPVLSVTVESIRDEPDAPSSSAGHTEPSAHVFISHAHADCLTAYNLNSVIERGFDGRLQSICTSLRRLPIPDTDDLFSGLGTLIRESSVFILLVTPVTLTRPVVTWELTYVKRKNAMIVFCKSPGLPEEVMAQVRNLVGPRPEFSLSDGEYEAGLIALIAEHTGVRASDHGDELTLKG